METTLIEFEAMLKNHDWYFSFSDDSNVYDRGSKEWKELKRLAKENPQYENLLKHEYKKRFNNPLIL